jgi:MFS family permease
MMSDPVNPNSTRHEPKSGTVDGLFADAPPPSSKAVSWETFFTTYLPAMILALGTGIALPAIPSLAMSFDVSFGVASAVVTSYLIGNLLGTLPSGWLIDHFGRRPVLIASPLITAVSALLVVVATTFTELLILRFISGFSAQMWFMARLAAISHGAVANERGRQVTWMFGMDRIGKLSGPVIGGFIAHQWGITAPFVAYGILALIALIPVAMFAKDTPKLVRGDAKSGGLSLSTTLRIILLPNLLFFSVALFAGLTRGPMHADMLHLYAAFAYNLGPIEIGYLATGAAMLSLPITFIAGWILDRFGRKRTMIPGFSGVSIAMACLAVSAWVPLSLTWYVVLFYFAVIGQTLTGGSIQTIGADIAPPQARGSFLGLWRFVGEGGATISPICFALLADHVNYSSSFLFTAACAAALTYILIRHVPETKTTT